MYSDLNAKLFPISLIGDAMDWVGKLPHASIENYKESYIQ